MPMNVERYGLSWTLSDTDKNSRGERSDPHLSVTRHPQRLTPAVTVLIYSTWQRPMKRHLPMQPGSSKTIYTIIGLIIKCYV